MSPCRYINADVLLPNQVVRGSVMVGPDGRIAAIDEGPGPGDIDLAGDLLMPGLIEVHTDGLEHFLLPRPGAYWPECAALLAHDGAVATAGITTVLDAISAGMLDDDGPRLRHFGTTISAINAGMAAGTLRVDHRLHIRCELLSPNLMDLVGPVISDPLVRLVSLMDHTPGQRGERDLGAFRRYYRERFGWSEAEIDTFMAARIQNGRANARRNRERVLELLRSFSLPLATHDDTTDADVAEAVADGASVAEFPTTMVSAAAAKAAGMAVIMGAPNLVRKGSNSGNVAAADIARAGLLDVLSSDYAPHSLLHGAWLLHTELGLPPHAALATVTSAPAKLLGFADRGRIEPGLRADLVLCQP